MTTDQKSKHLIRSDFADIVIKVDADLYYLDRLQLALKSDYFDKLFTEDFQEKKSDLIELPIMDSDTFCAVVDVIYEKELSSVLTDENFVSLLIAMDYLQMEINLQDYVESINRVSYNKVIFKLYNFILGNQNFEALLPTVLMYFSSHLTDIRDCEEFLSLPLEYFITIISAKRNCYDVQYARKFCQICVEWIWHDVENRFPHTLKIVNAAKCGLSFPYGTNDNNLLINLRNISREKNLKKFVEYFHRLLIHKGEINAVDDESMPAPTKKEKKQIKSIRFSENGERDKLAKYLNNGDFSDITVIVEGKTYKLHRVKLRSTSDYFEDLLSAELSTETSGQPEQPKGALRTSIQQNQSKEYFLDEVDQTTFDAIVNYIYFGETILEVTSDNFVRLLKAAFILKIQKLVDECESRMRNDVEKISSELVVEIYNFTNGNDRFREFYKFYFRKRVPVEWPEIGNDITLFRSLTFDVLEEILLIETLNFFTIRKPSSVFCNDDSNKLLDICSTWVVHDVENRYHLIPRIVFAINSNGTVDYDDYKMKTPAEFTNCSQKFVRDKLWEILCSTSLVPSNASLGNAKKEFKEEPAFISWANKNEMNILSGDLDHIASLRYHAEDRNYLSEKFFLSATMIDDNVFILAEHDLHPYHLFFQVYNLSLKKFISLSGVFKLTIMDNCYFKYKLLNCCNEVYCCFENGCVIKYSIQLNRWFKISDCRFENNVLFASDGKKLYITYNMNERSSQYVVNFYDFEQNVWISSPNLSFSMENNYESLLNLTFVNGCELCVLLESSLYVYNNNLHKWLKFRLPERFYSYKPVVAVTQCVNGIFLVTENKLYHFSESNRNGDYWELRKELSSKLYNTIFAIHRPDVCTT